MKRRTRKNPGGLMLTLTVGSLIASVVGVALALRRKHPPQTLPNGMQFDPTDKPGFIGLPDDQFRQIPPPSPADGPMFLFADVSRLGFQVPGVHEGSLVFEIVGAPNLATRTILAVSRDDRFPDTAQRAIPQAAITGLAA